MSTEVPVHKWLKGPNGWTLPCPLVVAATGQGLLPEASIYWKRVTCPLCLKGRPEARLVPKKTDRWLQGYACAVAILQKLEGGFVRTTTVKELAGAGGLTEESCKAAGVDESDMEVLFPPDCVNPRCLHLRGWHRKGTGACLECGCLEYVEPKKENACVRAS